MTSDGILACELADGTLLVCASNVNEKNDLLRTKSQLTQIGANVLGVVLSRMPAEKKHYGSYGYGYGYGYGQQSQKHTKRRLRRIKKGTKNRKSI